MAEAVVEERPSVHARFYCHMCNVEINIPNSDYTCPLCSGGFVEELPPPTTTTNVPAGSSTSSNNSRGGTNQYQQRQQQQQQQQQRQHHQHQPPLPLDMDVLRNELATLLASRNGPNLEISIDPGNGRVNTRGNLLSLVGNTTGTGARTGSAIGTSGNNSNNANNTAGGRLRPQNLDRFDNVLLNFLLSISGETEMPTFGNAPMVFMGNLGDYAWGREGLDTIVTQLLNQMETSGPPPLSKQKINEIPKVGVSAEEVERKLQCSVCWEDFILNEMVRKLPCSHLYHEECIVPWLDLHGTCPICRKLLNDDDDDDVSMETQEFTPTHSCPVHGASSNDNNATQATATAAVTSTNRTRNLNSTTTATPAAPGAAITTTATTRNNNSSTNEAAATAATSQISQRIFCFDDMDFSNSDLD